MEYQLELKQIVDYPRCRIYREFVRRLMNDPNFRTHGSSYLYYYIVLCSYANFRSSYRKMDGITYLVSPGEWICTPQELSSWFRTRFQHQAISILDFLQSQNYITYTRLDRNRLIKFHISDWKANNTSLEYNYPCQKDVGFFFFPVSVVHELVSMGKCSEMDIILDMWIHAIYNDPQVQGSDVGPVVYFRDHTGRPLITCRELALRWGLSKSSISRLLKKLESHEYLTVVSFTGTHGSVLYLQGYLSTMFSISDVMVDKEEVSLTFQLPVTLDDEASRCLSEADIGKSLADILPETEQIYVSDNTDSVPETHILKIIQKSAKVLAAQGVFCCECSKSKYKLYRLSACRRDIYRYSLQIGCSESNIVYHFELSIQPMLQSDPSIKFDDAVPSASPVQKQTTNSHEEEHYETDKQ